MLVALYFPDEVFNDISRYDIINNKKKKKDKGSNEKVSPNNIPKF